MRYIGSKCASLQTIHEMARIHVPAAQSICDPFAGTCTVARSFKSKGFRVHTGDSLAVSYLHQKVHIQMDELPAPCDLAGHSVAQLMANLNNLNPIHGYITEHYSQAGPEKRNFFTPENAMRLDAAIDWLRNASADVSEDASAYTKLCLIEAMDRVANTAGTYYAYLKKVGRKAVKPIDFKAIDIAASSPAARHHSIERAPAQDVVRKSNADIIYLDPPYNRRNYSAYYHLPETIALGIQNHPKGRSGIPDRPLIDSPFYHRQTATSALSEIISSANSKAIIFHYTTDGVIDHSCALEMLSAWGKTVWHDVDVRSYSTKAGSEKTRAGHRIYVSVRR